LISKRRYGQDRVRQRRHGHGSGRPAGRVGSGRVQKKWPVSMPEAAASWVKNIGWGRKLQLQTAANFW